MNSVVTLLAGRRALPLLLLTAIAIAIGFELAAPLLGGSMLDLVYDPARTHAVLAAMSADERSAHMIVTLTLDMVYPIAYGGALAGLAARLARCSPMAWAAPALLLILVDLAENLLIVALLGGHEEVIAIKGLATVIKWWLFGFASLLCLGLAGAAIWSRVPARRCSAGLED